MKKFDFSKEFGNIDPKYISEAEGEWKAKKKPWTPNGWSKVAAACVIVTLGSVIFSNPKVQAAMKNFTLSIGETLGFSKEIESYTEVMNTSKTDKGITVTLKEVVVDDGVLIAKIHAEKADSGQQENASDEISMAGTGFSIDDQASTINGQKIEEYGSGSYLPYLFDDLSDLELDENVYDAVLESRFYSSVDIGDDPEIHLVIEADNEESLGKEPLATFAFDFSISHTELMEQTVHKKLDDISIETEEGTVKLTDFSMNGLQSTILAEVPEELYRNYEVELRGTDSKGNMIRYELNSGSDDETRHWNFKTSFFEMYLYSDEPKLLIPDIDSDYVELQLYTRTIDPASEYNAWDVDIPMAEVGETIEEVVEVSEDEDQTTLNSEAAEEIAIIGGADGATKINVQDSTDEIEIIGGADGATEINVQNDTDENVQTTDEDDFYIEEENNVWDGYAAEDGWEAVGDEVKIQIK